MPRRARLDTELVRRGLAPSREQAGELIAAGLVTVGGAPAAKPATAVAAGAAVAVREGDRRRYVSRGGDKLAAALAAFAAATPALHVAGRRCLDAGASTGGFTDALLQAGAAQVVAVDVGYGQLAWALRTDPRVVVLERTNVRHLTPQAIDGQVDVAVADLSFIGLGVVLPALAGCVRPEGDLVTLVKPQFEVGRERLGKGGVVRDPGLRAEAVIGVAHAAEPLGLGVRGVVASPLPGPSGNVEYLLWLARGGADRDPAALAALVAAAVTAGPQ